MNKVILTGLVVVLFSAVMQAQNEGNVGNVEINVFESYKATVRTANKRNEMPNFDDTTTQKIPVTYRVIPSVVETRVHVEPIKAASIARTRVKRLPENMVKLGMGNYITPEFSLILANARSQSTSWSLSADHFSTQTGALRDEVVFNDNATMSNRLQSSVKHVTNRWRWTGGVDINLRDYSYYGIPRMAGVNEHLIDSDPTRQGYYTYGVKAGIERALMRGTQAFRGVDVSYHFLHDRYSAQEHFVKTMADWTIGAGDLDVYLGTGFDYLDYSADGANTSAMAFRLKPAVQHEVNGIHFTVGLNLNYVRSTVFGVLPEGEEPEAKDRLYFFPEVRAELPLVRNVLNLYGGWVGDVDLNGLSGLSGMNPYIAPDVEVRETGVNKIYAGFSGRISKRFGYNIQGDYYRYANKAMFYRDSTALATGVDPYISVLYTDLDVLSPRAELTFHHPSGVEVSAEGTYFTYNRRDDSLAYHLPEFQGALRMAYTWKEKVVLRTDLIATGSRYAFTPGNEETGPQMPAFLDWRFYSEYRYNDFLSAYLSLNNLLNQKYDLWYGYPAQGTRFIIGLTLRF